MGKAKEPEERALPSVALVLGYLAVKEEKDIDIKIMVLERLGYGTREIASILGKQPEYVRVRRSRMKKKGRETKNGSEK